MSGVSSQPEGADGVTEVPTVKANGDTAGGISRRDIVKVGAVAAGAVAGAAFLGGLPIFAKIASAQAEAAATAEGSRAAHSVTRPPGAPTAAASQK